MKTCTRIGSTLLALLLLCGSLAACGTPTPSGTDTTPPVDTTEPQAPSTTAAPDTTAAPKPLKPYAPVELQLPDDPSLLYNGIRLPETWPPEHISSSSLAEIEIPYLKNPDEGGTHPDVVDIDVGRQLFVDDFLIESTTLTAVGHKPVEYAGNPVMQNGERGLSSKNGGVYYNAEKQKYEMFFFNAPKLMYISSDDGINWDEKSAYPVLSMPYGGYVSVVYNETPDAANPRYICLVRYSNYIWEDLTGKNSDHDHYTTRIYYSNDGQIWRMLTDEGPDCGDATTMVYNPFRRTWIFSLRRGYNRIRCRDYVECQDILDVADFSDLNVVFWMRADGRDLRHEKYPNIAPELYAMSAVAYESIMLGAFQMFQGPTNEEIKETSIPKITNIHFGYSRDGFYYSRPDRTAALESSRDTAAWDCGYLHPTSGVCVIVGDELRFYYAAYQGQAGRDPDSANYSLDMTYCRIGIATLRRDGFVSLDGSGEVITRLMRFDEQNDRLFINAKAKSIRAEICDADGCVIPGFSLDDCVPFSGDSTCAELTFGSGKNLGELKGLDFSIRFLLEEGEFYAFWVSDTEDGESGGFLAGGYDAR